MKQRFINVNIVAQNLKKMLDKSNSIWYNPICLIPISKLVISFAMLTTMTEKLDYGDITVMKYQFSMAGLVKNLLK